MTLTAPVGPITTLPSAHGFRRNRLGVGSSANPHGELDHAKRHDPSSAFVAVLDSSVRVPEAAPYHLQQEGRGFLLRSETITRATSEMIAFGLNVSAKIRALSSIDQWRRATSTVDHPKSRGCRPGQA
ncbi:MAG: hypothetical protein E5Y63_30425 [Mesorhizobium sp.]|uniref:hypothetical protein n=1 Tax=Mesorhizobium sp. TaxID=1871066 RepID=UPI001220489C|nr:hypothetical protein [Mesorhizobium sp.]TIM26233.1 MAG: hypothetical protein E5Y63_30425 [Mesorhizobium sp.]TIO22791.1 MAG: hypothetical protein E5X83_23610 [Mesorhizobium sp.]